MSSMRAFERWIEKQFGVLAHAAGRSLDDLLDLPEGATRSGLPPEATFALGVIVGAAGTLELSPSALLEQLDLWTARRPRAAGVKTGRTAAPTTTPSPPLLNGASGAAPVRARRAGAPRRSSGRASRRTR